MPLIYNGKLPKKIFYNRNFVDKVIYNTNLVWSYELPDGYAKVDYLQTQGNAWLATDITPDDNTELEITASNITSTSAQLMVSQTTGQGNFRIVKTSAQQKIAGTIGSSTISSDSNGISKFTAKLNTNGFYLNGVLIGTFSQPSTSNLATVDIFSGKYGSSRYYTGSGSRLFEAIIRENGVEVFHGIPAKDSSDILGLYDVITDTFLTNQGSGSFIEGSELLLNMNNNDRMALGGQKSSDMEIEEIMDPDVSFSMNDSEDKSEVLDNNLSNDEAQETKPNDTWEAR